MAVVPVGPPALSPDGRYVLQGGHDGAGRVFDLRDGSLAALLRPRGLPKAQADYYDGGPDFGAAFAPDGSHVATVSFDGVARVWDWRARRVVATSREVGKVRVAFSPDGRTFAAGATLWDWRANRARTIDSGDEEAFRSRVAFAPGGRYVASVAVSGGTRVWDVRARRTVAQLPVARAPVRVALQRLSAPGGCPALM
jgi:WD40 repeat protein